MPRPNARTWLLALAVALTAALAACNGGITISLGGSTTPAGTTPASTTPGASATSSAPPGTTAAAPSPLKNVKKGWRVETVYQSPLVNPSSLAVDGSGTLLVVSLGTGDILSLNPDRSFSPYADTSSLAGIFCIGYQAAKQRLLILDENGNLYGASGGQLTKLRSGLFATTISVAPDGSFYGGLAVQGSSITRYDAEGKAMETVVKNVDGCYQVLLDAAADTLYYSETYAGRISAVDLSDGSVRVLTTGAGIPGTYEPIPLGLDGDGTLYYFTGNQGLNRYENGTFRKIMDSPSGTGNMVWSPDFNAFLVANQAGSNLIAIDPAAASWEFLTPYLNAWGIVERGDGTVLIAENVISKVTADGLEPFVTDLPTPCYHLTRDGEGNIYAGTIDGRLWRIHEDGSYEPWASGFTDWFIVSLSYDAKNDALVAVAGNHETSRAEVWRVPLADPSAPVKLADFSGVRVTPHLPTATADEDGTIYILERQRNVVYRISDGATEPQAFIENVLENEAITVPGLAYSRAANGLVVSTIQTYDLWPLDTRKKQVLAENNGGVDNFAVSEGPGGDLVLMTSGRVLRLVPDG